MKVALDLAELTKALPLLSYKMSPLWRKETAWPVSARFNKEMVRSSMSVSSFPFFSLVMSMSSRTLCSQHDMQKTVVSTSRHFSVLWVLSLSPLSVSQFMCSSVCMSSNINLSLTGCIIGSVWVTIKKLTLFLSFASTVQDRFFSILHFCKWSKCICEGQTEWPNKKYCKAHIARHLFLSCVYISPPLVSTHPNTRMSTTYFCIVLDSTRLYKNRIRPHPFSSWNYT